MKILIGVPCMEQVSALFCQSLALLQTAGECSLKMQINTLIYTARNNIAAVAMAEGYDLVFWLDSDMVFKPDTLVRMLKVLDEKNLDILTGLYFRRVPPYSAVLFKKLEIDGKDCEWSEFDEIPESLFEIGGCGFGCVLMRTKVFADILGRFDNIFAPMGNNGEDIAFCVRARESGYKIYCDPTIRCGHVGYQVINGRRGKDGKAKG